MSNSDLRAKYGAGTFDAGLKLQPRSFERRVAQRDSLDQHFTRLWLGFTVTGVSQRPALDTPGGAGGGRPGPRDPGDHSPVCGLRRTHDGRAGDRGISSGGRGTWPTR